MKKYLLIKYLFLLSILFAFNNNYAQVVACITHPSMDTVICRGVSVVLTAKNCLSNTTPAQESYSWINLSNPGSLLANNSAVSDTGRWEVTVVNNNDGSSSTATVHIQYKPEPGPVGGPTTFGINYHAGYLGKCANTSATLQETSGDANVINHKWYQVSDNSLLYTGASYVISAPVPGNDVAVVALYTVTGCLLKDTIYVTDFPESKPDLGNDVNLCQGQNIKLKPTGLDDLGQGYLHKDSEYEFDWGSGFQADSELVVSTTQYVKLRVRGPFPYPCISKDSVQVTVYPNPTVSITNPNLTNPMCYGDTLNGLAASVSGAAGPFTYAWSPNTRINDQTLPTVNVSPLSTAAYTVTVKTALNCQSTASSTVYVYTQVNPQFTFTDTTICTGASVQFSGSATGGTGPYTYSWSPVTDLINDATATPTSSPASNITYTMEVKDSKNCIATKPLNVSIASNVPPFVTANVTFADSIVCPGSSINLQAYGSGGSGTYSYLWNPSPSLTGGNTNNPSVSPTVPTSYSVVVTDSRNCSDNATVSIDMLYVNLVKSVTTVKIGDSLKLDASNPSTAGFNYSWKDSTGTNIGSGPTYIAKSSGKYIVEVSNGTCFVSDSLVLKFVAELVQIVYVPNVLSPERSESDNSNLRVYGMNISDENFLFRIYDQWSHLVYETDNFKTANEIGWNGTMKNVGQLLNPGVYTYFVKGQFYDETTFEKTGTASLLR